MATSVSPSLRSSPTHGQQYYCSAAHGSNGIDMNMDDQWAIVAVHLKSLSRYRHWRKPLSRSVPRHKVGLQGGT
jgi:hypothetical protein